MGRRLQRIVCAVASLAVLVAALATAASSADARPPAARPSVEQHAAGAVRDGRYDARAARSLARGLWGGRFTTASGISFILYASDAYPVNPAWLQWWADWMDARLYHGDELAAVTVVFATPAEVQVICGANADACYAPDSGRIVTPGDDPPDGQFMRTILAHEYGHHVTTHRANPPWQAAMYGPKRWASYEHVCERVAAGQAFPGDEAAHYSQNPAEAWSQVYATAVQSLQPWPDGSWPSVGPWAYDIMFYPDAQSLALARQDAEQPWTTVLATKTTWRGQFTQKTVNVRRRLATRYDGTLTLTAARPVGAVLTLRDATNGRLLARSLTSLSFTVCGQRALTVGIGGGARQRYQVTATAP